MYKTSFFGTGAGIATFVQLPADARPLQNKEKSLRIYEKITIPQIAGLFMHDGLDGDDRFLCQQCRKCNGS